MIQSYIKTWQLYSTGTQKVISTDTFYTETQFTRPKPPQEKHIHSPVQTLQQRSSKASLVKSEGAHFEIKGA